jgi:hypothetical protein
MAVVTVKSNQITNRDASPRVINNARTSNGDERHARDTFVITSGDSAASTYRICSIPSRAIPISVRLSAPDIGTTTTADVGLYRNTADGGAVVDADFFASAVSLNGGAISKSEVVFESGVITLANSSKPIWELLGLTVDPTVDYDVVLTLVGAADGTGTGLLEVDFSV